MTTAENRSKGRKVRRLLLASTLLALATSFSPRAHAQEETPGASTGGQDSTFGEHWHPLGSPLEGTWLFDIDIPSRGITFQSLISFTGGGVVITTGSRSLSITQYGSWRQTGARRFHAVFYRFIPDASGVGVALSKISLDLQLTSRNTLTGTAVGANCDLQGENCEQTPDELRNTGKKLLPE